MYGNAQPAPPVNNLLQPDIYNRLDAEVLERTRVANTQLAQRLSFQQKILAKYRLAAERFYRQEKNVVRKELVRISSRLPAVHRIRDFRNKFLYGEGLQDQHKHLSQSVPDLRPNRKIRGVPEEKPEHPFCERFFLHHLPNKKKFYKARKSSSPQPPRVQANVDSSGVDGDDGGGGAGGDGGVSLPPIPGTEPAATTADEKENSSVQVQSVHFNSGNVSQAGNGDNVLDSQVSLCANEASDEVSSLRNNNHAEEGRQSRRKSPKGRTTVLPPLHRQNLRLAHSSPQLFHG